MLSNRFAEIYAASMSKETISKVTDRVIEEITYWQNGPLDQVCVAIFIDAMVVKARVGQRLRAASNAAEALHTCLRPARSSVRLSVRVAGRVG